MDLITKSTRQSDEIMTVMSLAGVQRPKLFAVMATAIMSISPIPSRIQYSVVSWVRNTNTHTHKCIPVSGPVGCCGGAVNVCRLTIKERQEGKRDVLV